MILIRKATSQKLYPLIAGKKNNKVQHVDFVKEKGKLQHVSTIKYLS